MKKEKKLQSRIAKYTFGLLRKRKLNCYKGKRQVLRQIVVKTK